MKPFEKWLLWGSTVATGVTGVAYMWMKYFMEPAEPWAVINHPLEPWMLKAHILAAPVMVFAVGLVTAGHIWKHFRNGVSRGRWSGTLAMVLLVPMVLTGYLIQTVTHAGWLKALAIAHIATGLVYVLGFVVHGLLPVNNGSEDGKRASARRGNLSHSEARTSPDGTRRSEADILKH